MKHSSPPHDGDDAAVLPAEETILAEGSSEPEESYGEGMDWSSLALAMDRGRWAGGRSPTREKKQPPTRNISIQISFLTTGDICDCASLKYGSRSFAIIQFGFANLPFSDIAILLQCLFTIFLLILGFSPPDLTKMPLRALAVDLVRLRCLAAMTVRPNQ
jgi:hypothetical protein